MLYDQVRRIDWPRVFSHEQSLFIKAAGSVYGTDFVVSFAPLKIKDAICDEFRKRGHARPDVDRQDPDVRVNAFFFRGRCELSIDLTGQALHRRGYRQDGAEAPLRENRAAALLLFSGYDGSRPLVDPFCGSGTIPIEAALIATSTAPGLLRDPESYSLMKLAPDAEPHLRREWDEAAAERREAPHPIRGLDLAKTARDTAAANVRQAGMESWVRIEGGDARSLVAPNSWIVTNPPYGERLQQPEEAVRLLKAFIHQVKHRCVGSRLGLVVPRGALEKSVGLRPEKRIAVESGPMKLRFLRYEIRAGRFTNRGIPDQGENPTAG